MKNKICVAIITVAYMLAVFGGIVLANSGLNNNINMAGQLSRMMMMSDKLAFDRQVDAIIANMSPEEKLGQMMMIGIYGTELTNDAAYMLNKYHIGSIILFDRNLVSKEQIRSLTDGLQQYAKETVKEPVPLFIAIDEEGGRVVRGKNIIEPPPSQADIGRSQNLAQAELWAQKTGTNLKSLGINVNLAPVADVGTTDTRSYSNDASTVASFVKAAANGYESVGEVYALKHFPGIGRGKVDTHKDVSSVDVSKETLYETDLKPFKTIIDQKENDRFFILVSHLKYSQLDPNNSASQSRAIVTDLLRQEMGYNGIIITDDLAMGAVAKYGSSRDSGVKSVKAGVDIVMMCHNYKQAAEIYSGLLDAYKTGELTEEQINASVRRIIRAKLLNRIEYTD